MLHTCRVLSHTACISKYAVGDYAHPSSCLKWSSHTPGHRSGSSAQIVATVQTRERISVSSQATHESDGIYSRKDSGYQHDEPVGGTVRIFIIIEIPGKRVTASRPRDISSQTIPHRLLLSEGDDESMNRKRHHRTWNGFRWPLSSMEIVGCSIGPRMYEVV